MIKYWAFRLAALVVPWVPLRVAQVVAQATGLALWALMPGARRRVDANLRHVPALASDPEQRRWAVRGVFRHLALNYVDAFRASRLSAAEIMGGWDIHGQDLFDATVARGRGVILLSAHLGNFEYSGARLAAMGHPVLIPAERLKPEQLFQLVSRLRSQHGVRLVPADSGQTLRDLYAALRAGQVVVVLADRDVLGTGVEVPFFGAPARLPAGPVLLARRSGAPVLGAFSWREGYRRSGGVFVPLDLTGAEAEIETNDASSGTAPPTTRLRGAAVARTLQPFVRVLEEQIAAHPQQWVSALAPIWCDSGAAEGSAV
jgi:KDO2-lipid IV(A) lauroyltransferase